MSDPAAGEPAPLHLVVMGVSAAGKTTVAREINTVLHWEFAEGDDFHPQANVDKMASGEPLVDKDRWPWLEALAEWIREQDAAGRSTIMTCSALKRSYRDVLRGAGATTYFVHLTGDRELLQQRMSARDDHFMPLELLDSQLATLEGLVPDEHGGTFDVAGTPEEIAADVLRELDLP
ncbi:gluconokinase [Ornithinimicrobium cryptoxanthini]|uniref:gluconokinase n=1 Tax=Ornithinimicrobium cryptoxanthini TaxID=2934161 RepID=UPI00211821C6|nr:gluconokinase [Ornithinimicrobium cryptoxanthini]